MIRAKSHIHAKWVALLFAVPFWAQSALAHPVKGQAIGFLTGFLHPISGLDHVLAMVPVGLWGAQLGAPAIWLLPCRLPHRDGIWRNAGINGLCHYRELK